MSDNFTQLDELIESDIREALGETVLEEDTKNDVTNVPEDLLDTPDEPEVLEPELEFELDESEGEVLDDIGDIEILPMAEIESALEDEEDIIDSTIPNVNTSDLAALLGQLLNNKTIEITIKVKD